MKKKQPLFSVLIANYNNGKYLMDAIESVRQQTYANWEIILVDDGSTDNSEQIYKELEKDERILIYRNEQNMGCGYTKRRCADLACGELCGFLDADDMLIENALELETDIHINNPQVSVVYSKCMFCDADLNVKEYGRLPVMKIGETYLDHRKHGPMNFASYKNLYYKKTEGINPLLKAGVDQDLYFRIEEVGDIYLLDEYTYKYISRNQENAITNEKNWVKLYFYNLMARRDAFMRRGIPEDQLLQDFAEIVNVLIRASLSQQEQQIRSSKAYRLGKALLKPFIWIKQCL